MDELRLTLSLVCEERVTRLFVISLISRVVGEMFSRPHFLSSSSGTAAQQGDSQLTLG